MARLALTIAWQLALGNGVTDAVRQLPVALVLVLAVFFDLLLASACKRTAGKTCEACPLRTSWSWSTLLRPRSLCLSEAHPLSIRFNASRGQAKGCARHCCA